MKRLFGKFAESISMAVGTPWAFLGAVTAILTWALSGPFFGFSEPWQLVINSFTTIVTFLVVFLIQNTQNRDFQALQIKIDALLLPRRLPPVIWPTCTT
jgi:low affinity Fe/Cu permease